MCRKADLRRVLGTLISEMSLQTFVSETFVDHGICRSKCRETNQFGIGVLGNPRSPVVIVGRCHPNFQAEIYTASDCFLVLAVKSG
jgi:hypothetical protein